MINWLLDWLEEWGGPFFLLGSVLLICLIVGGIIYASQRSGVVTYNTPSGEIVTVRGTVTRNGYNVTVVEKNGTTHVIFVPCTIKYDE